MQRQHATIHRDLLLGIVVALMGLLYLLIIPWQISAANDGYENISGRTLPYLIAAIILFLGTALAWRSHAKLKKISVSEGGRIPQRIPTRKKDRNVVLYIAVIALYALAMEYIGYVVSTTIVLLYAMWINGARNKFAVALAAIVLPGLIYGLFRYVMQVPFPYGLLF